MNKREKKFRRLIMFISLGVFVASFTALVFGDFLARTFDVIGIRIATLFVAFASFVSTSTFSYLVYIHNKTISETNDDMNKRAELFRELQFTSNNYSIIEFKNSMKIYGESERYISKYLRSDDFRYHMVLQGVNIKDVLENQDDYIYLTLKIPFIVVEGKKISRLIFDKIRFDRGRTNYYFYGTNEDNLTFVLYDEITQMNNAIINLVIKKDSDFFRLTKVNEFSKIKLHIRITSLLAVEVAGVIELYFSNPDEISAGNIHEYPINSSNLEIVQTPKIVEYKSNH